ncbi:hypothetical protein [Candidatus Pyrohabitans sp.]
MRWAECVTEVKTQLDRIEDNLEFKDRLAALEKEVALLKQERGSSLLEHRKLIKRLLLH